MDIPKFWYLQPKNTHSHQYTAPEGGYYVVVNIRQIKIPETFVFPTNIANRGADYKASW
jgi:kynurenine aminotransferase